MSQTKRKVIAIKNDAGGENLYETLASRWVRFLEAFPISSGYSVVVKSYEFLGKRPALAALYQEAVKNGLKPDDAGLPKLGSSFVFEAELLKDGIILAKGSSLKVIATYKDWEIGETAARQRLAAAAGFAGDILDKDEIKDMADQNLEAWEKEFSEPQETQPQTQPAVEAEPQENVKPEPKPKPVKKAKVAKEDTVEKQSSDVPKALLAQIAHQAKMKGLDVPVVNTIQEAKSALSTILAS